MCYTNLLMNPKGYYFVVTDSAMDKLDYSTLANLEAQGCKFVRTIDELYQAHCDFCNEEFGNEMEPEDVAGTEYSVMWVHGQFLYMCDRGIMSSFDEDVCTEEQLVKALMEFEL